MKKDIGALMLALVPEDFDARKAAVAELVRTGQPGLAEFFDDWRKGNLYVWNGRVVLSLESKTDAAGQKKLVLLDPLTRKPLEDNGAALLADPKDAKAMEVSRRERGLANEAITLVKLYDPDLSRRLSAIGKAGDNGVEAAMPALQELAKTDPSEKVRHTARESIALIEVRKTGDAEALKTRLAAVTTLGELKSLKGLSILKDLAKEDKEIAASNQYAQATEKLESWQRTVDWTGYGFAGLSAASILILVALGLAIIFGLMGVINMAHGELMMIGAYTTYLVQLAFIRFIPESSYNLYFVLAVPAAFIVAAGVGMLIELLVVRHLYGRPLDTLLATWGVSLILVQIVRLAFGDNIGVKAPTWFQGGVEVVQDVTLPYARLFIMVFCVVCVALIYFIMTSTKLGLLLRATTQNRAMASALGVPTRRIDLYTFGLGAGLAGLAGCALTLTHGVTPDMGQNYSIDAFLVVVTGGVGKLAGTVATGTGQGVLNQLLEPLVQTVWAKVIILLLVIVFIQFKPSGLFPAKGRLADA